MAYNMNNPIVIMYEFLGLPVEKSYLSLGHDFSVNPLVNMASISIDPKNTLPLMPRFVKLVEEIGELSEAIMHKQGFLPHKTMKEPPEGEVADVIICAMDVLGALYPEFDRNQLGQMIAQQLDKKCDKWKAVNLLRFTNESKGDTITPVASE